MSTNTIQLRATVDMAAAAEGKAPSLHILAYSGGMMRVGGIQTVIDLSKLEIPPSIPLLADHDPSLDGIVGVGAARVEGGKLLIDGTLAASAERAQQILQLHKSGVPFGASVGVEITTSEMVKHGTANGRSFSATDGMVRFIKSGKLRETSILSMGADSNTSVNIAASRGRKNFMDTNNQAGTAPANDAGNDEDAQSLRMKTFCEISAKYTNVKKEQRELLLATANDEQWAANRFELEMLRADRPQITAHRRARDPMDGANPRQLLTASLLCKLGMETQAEKILGPEIMERSKPMHRMHLLDLCKAALSAEHIECPASQVDLVKAAISTISLPNALGDTANRLLLQSYNETPATWRSFANILPAADFRTQKAIRPTFTGQMTELAPGGEIEHGGVSDSDTTNWSVRTFAKMLGIDRRDIVNDDLSLFDQTGRAYGKMAMRGVSDLVYSTILANSGSFFSSGHANYLETGSALSDSTLGQAITAMRIQRDAEHNDLDIAPAVLVVPPELAETAKQALESEYRSRAAELDQVGTGNPLKNAVRLEIEQRLSNTDKFTTASLTNWFLFASPQDAAIIVGFLGGVQVPTVEFFGLQATVNKLEVSWRVYFDYGCALNDYRAAVAATGAADES